MQGAPHDTQPKPSSSSHRINPSKFKTNSSRINPCPNQKPPQDHQYTAHLYGRSLDRQHERTQHTHPSRLNPWRRRKTGQGREGTGKRTMKRRNWARKRSAAAPPPPEPASQRPSELMRESTLCTLSSSSSASIAASPPLRLSRSV
jgi:hypothetical protein